jgi:hypothetical protein
MHLMVKDRLNRSIAQRQTQAMFKGDDGGYGGTRLNEKYVLQSTWQS